MLTVLICLTGAMSMAQTRYLDTTAFLNIQETPDIEFGSSITNTGVTQTLYLDFYEPVGDSLTARPLMIWIHGGGYTDGTRQDEHIQLWCRQFAHRGYVTASIDYRLGISGGTTGKIKAIYRSVQDAKAAVRFFRRYADTYGIDTNKIIIAGSSVGAFTAVHTAYWDTDELPASIDTLDLGNLEGNSGNLGYASDVAAVVNFWGAIKDSTWMDADEPMIASAAGVWDSVVYPGSYTWSSGEEHGSIVIDRVAASLGLPHTLRMFENAKHTLAGGGTDQRARWDTATAIVAEFLYCNLITNCDITEVQSLSPAAPSFFLYPNPGRESVTIKVGKAQIGRRYELTDQWGRSVITGILTSEETVILLEDLAPGVYLVEVEDTLETIRLVRE